MNGWMGYVISRLERAISLYNRLCKASKPLYCPLLISFFFFFSYPLKYSHNRWSGSCNKGFLWAFTVPFGSSLRFAFLSSRILLYHASYLLNYFLLQISYNSSHPEFESFSAFFYIYWALSLCGNTDHEIALSSSSLLTSPHLHQINLPR